MTIGAATTQASLAASEELRRHAPAFWDAANARSGVDAGDWAADYAAVLLALDARLTLAGDVSFAEAPHSAYESGVAVNLELAGGRIASARIALAGLRGTASRSDDLETALRAADPSDPDALRAACIAAPSEPAGLSDVVLRTVERASRR